MSELARIWKEPYDIERAQALNIHGHEGLQYVGTRTEGDRVRAVSGAEVRQLGTIPTCRWIYFVNVCSFTFAFFTLGQIQVYLDYYSVEQFSFHGRHNYTLDPKDRQSPLDRLPMRLRNKSKRGRVVKALEQALRQFQYDDVDLPPPAR